MENKIQIEQNAADEVLEAGYTKEQLEAEYARSMREAKDEGDRAYSARIMSGIR